MFVVLVLAELTQTHLGVTRGLMFLQEFKENSQNLKIHVSMCEKVFAPLPEFLFMFQFFTHRPVGLFFYVSLNKSLHLETAFLLVL